MVKVGAKDVQNEDDIKGSVRPLPGRYHVWVKDVTEKEINGADKVIVEFEVLAGTTPGQEGRGITEFFAVSEKALPRLQRLAIILGLLKPGEPERDIHFVDGVMRQLVIEVEENKYKNKDGKEIEGVRVGYLGFWSLGNPAVSDVPRDAEAAAHGVNTQTDDGFGDTPPAQTETPPQSPGADSNDPWADL